MKVHVNILVSGRVQKIGFRYSTLEVAEQLGIFGFVRNQPDGKVYIEAEGEKEIIDTFIAWCHQGPVWAHVDEVEVEKSEVRGFPTFEIMRG